MLKLKQKLIGKSYNCDGPEGNNSTLTNIPDRRIKYRKSVYARELRTLLNP